MRWVTHNWQLKLLALALSIFLWLVLHFNTTVRTVESPIPAAESK